MNISFWLNGAYRQEEIEPGMLLIDFLREKGCFSVKRGCETANCGLCTVLLDERPVLSCSVLAARIDGKKVVMSVKPGDMVIYSKYAGNEVKLEDEEYIIVKQSDILAIVE